MKKKMMDNNKKMDNMYIYSEIHLLKILLYLR